MIAVCLVCPCGRAADKTESDDSYFHNYLFVSCYALKIIFKAVEAVYLFYSKTQSRLCPGIRFSNGPGTGAGFLVFPQ